MRRSALVLLLACAACTSPADPTETGTSLLADTLAAFVPALGGPYDTVQVREWTDDDGLPTPIVQIALAPDGGLWATTEQGVIRFDGRAFHVFSDATTPELATNDFVGLFVARNGDVWVGDRERRTYRYRDGAWSRYDLEEVLTKGRWVRAFTEDAEGTIWAATGQGSVARFNGDEWALVPQLIKGRWSPIAADASGTVWTILPDTSVARWTGERFERAAGFEDIVQMDAPPSGLVVQRRVGTLASGESLFEVSDVSGARIGRYASADRPKLVRMVDRAGRLWLHDQRGLEPGALQVVEDEDVVFEFAPAGITQIEKVVEDDHGSVWLNADNTGLFQLSASPYTTFRSESPPLLTTETASLAPDGSVLVSQSSGWSGTHVATIRDGSLSMGAYRLVGPPPEDPDYIRDGEVRAGNVVEGPTGQRWGSVGPFLLRLTDGQAEIVGRATDVISTTLSDRAGEVWVGAVDGEIARYESGQRGLAFERVLSGEIRLFHRAADGRLWVGGDGGLVARTAGGGWRAVADTLDVRGLTETADGALWLATGDHGLVGLRDGGTRAFRVPDGLPTDHLSFVALDSLGFMWLGAGRSMLRLHLDTADAFLDGTGEPPSVTKIPASAGHGGVSRWVRRVAVDEDGAIWVPSMDGVVRIDPARFAHQHAHHASVSVEALRTEDGTTFHPADGLRLPLGARQVEIDYTATDLLAPDLVRFRTRLDGHDDGWVDRGAERQVTYGGLGPGAYTLHLQAMNASGTWGEAIAVPAFVVPPRLWETWWFRLFGLTALVGLVASAYRARVQSLTERQRVLGALVAERTAALETEKETVAAQARDLAALNETKTRLFANVSHEFRTPLTLTLGPLDDVLSEAHGPITPQTRAQLHLARRNADRVLDLVGQILDVSRMESGEVELKTRALDLGAFVEMLGEGVRPLAERKAINLSVSVPAHPVPVSADPVLLEKAIANLIANALKFTLAGGSVRVSLTADDRVASVSVRDSGPGIAAEDLPHVFDRFYQAASPDRPAEPGTGIGLALAREVAHLHEGMLAVESEEGFGSLFTLSLPLGAASDDEFADPPAAPADALAEPTLQPPAGEEDAPDRTTVLVVEDHGDVRAYVRQHLAPAYRVLEAADGVEGLERARTHLPDLILSDLMMPRMDGIALCRALKEDPETAFIPVVLLTARAATEDRLDGLGSGADDYLTKPVDVRELKARVENLIASRQRLRDLLAEPSRGDGALRATTIDAVSSDNAFLSAVRDAVERHLADETFSVERLAHEMGVSRAHLYRRLRDLDGRSPWEIIRTLRLERAAQLLEAGAGTVSEVAYAVGFKSVSHFSNAFTAHIGCRPSVYPEGA